MGNSIKKHMKSSPKSTSSPSSSLVTTMTNKANPFLTSAATPPVSTKSNILLVCDDEFMKQEALDRLWSKSDNREIEGHEITAFDLSNDIYMFYGGRGGYRPLRHTVGKKIAALIVCIDNTQRKRKSHLTSVRHAVGFVSGDRATVPLLIIGMPPNEASKAAKRKEEKQKIAAAKKRQQESIKKRMMKSIKNKLNPSSINDKIIDDQQINNNGTKTMETEETPMDSAEIESLLNEDLALQSNAFFSSYYTISLTNNNINNNDNNINNTTNNNDNDDTLAQGMEWLKKALKGENASNGDDQPPAVVKDLDEGNTVKPLMVAAARTEVNLTSSIESTEIVASA